MLRWGEGDRRTHQGQVIIDPEMGAFGDNGCIDFIRTQWDNEMDKKSLLPGMCITFTMMSGYSYEILTPFRIIHL